MAVRESITCQRLSCLRHPSQDQQTSLCSARKGICVPPALQHTVGQWPLALMTSP